MDSGVPPHRFFENFVIFCPSLERSFLRKTRIPDGIRFYQMKHGFGFFFLFFLEKNSKFEVQNAPKKIPPKVIKVVEKVTFSRSKPKKTPKKRRKGQKKHVFTRFSQVFSRPNPKKTVHFGPKRAFFDEKTRFFTFFAPLEKGVPPLFPGGPRGPRGRV